MIILGCRLEDTVSTYIKETLNVYNMFFWKKILTKFEEVKKYN